MNVQETNWLTTEHNYKNNLYPFIIKKYNVLIYQTYELFCY